MEQGLEILWIIFFFISFKSKYQADKHLKWIFFTCFLFVMFLFRVTILYFCHALRYIFKKCLWMAIQITDMCYMKIRCQHFDPFTWPYLFIYTFKEYIERRHGEPFKFLFLPKIGLLGSQACTTKKSPILNYEQLLSSVFSTFHGQKFIFWIYFLHCSVCTKNLPNRKVNFFFFLNWKEFFWVKNCFF